jgi:hypothetical protein
VKEKALPPMIVWTWPEGMPGLMMGSARSTTRGEMQGRHQNAVTGLKRDKASRRTAYEDAMFNYRGREIVWRSEGQTRTGYV